MFLNKGIIIITNNIIAPGATLQKQEKEEGTKTNSIEETGSITELF